MLIKNGAKENYGNSEFASLIKEKINTRNEARKRKDFEVSDRLRRELLSEGVILEDLRSGSVDWRYISNGFNGL